MNYLLSHGYFAGQRQHTELFVCGLAIGKYVKSLAMQLWPTEVNSACLSSAEGVIWAVLPNPAFSLLEF